MKELRPVRSRCEPRFWAERDLGQAPERPQGVAGGSEAAHSLSEVKMVKVPLISSHA